MGFCNLRSVGRLSLALLVGTTLACTDTGPQPRPPVATPAPITPPPATPTPQPTLPPTAAAFNLQLLHFADVDGEGGAADVRGFSALVDGFRRQMPANTLLLSSGDNWIPGPEYFGARDARLDPSLGQNGPGRAHVGWLNALGVQASAVGNHELDLGPGEFIDIIAPDGAWPGAQFPYLSANIDFSADSDAAPLIVPDGQPARPASLAGSVTVVVGGETIGIVAATTPSLPAITSPGAFVVSPADRTDIGALAAIIQQRVDALTQAGVNKIILLGHMQQIAIERELATRLRDVDIIIAGGSNTLLVDSNDSLREGDTAGGTYPETYLSASSAPVLLVNTAGDFNYLGRLVVSFNNQGVLLPNTVDPSISGAYRSDQLPATFSPLPAVVALTDALETVLVEKDGNVMGLTSVFLEGRRSAVRSEETNLGNLTADANLWYAQRSEPETLISLKNGGGIRAEIGLVLQPAGTSDPTLTQFLPPQANASSGKPAGGISQLDIETALRFNNRLVTLTVTAAELADLIEHSVSGANPGATPGSFPQVGGVRFSFDASRPARTGGDTNRGAATTLSRVQNLAVVDDSGAVIDQIAIDGALQGDLSRSFRIVTLNFAAEACVLDPAASCGDGYPYKGLAAPNLVNLSTADDVVDPGLAMFSAQGREQDALAEYLQAFFATVPFAEADVPAAQDLRIQNLAQVASDSVHRLPTRTALQQIGRFVKPGAVFDESAAEIVAYHPGTRRLFVINALDGQVDVLDIADPTQPALLQTLDPVADLNGAFGAANSVAAGGNLIAVAVEADPQTAPGRIVFYAANDLSLLGSVTAGALPDALAFTPDGRYVVVANEGEPPADPADSDLRDFGNDPEGSLTVIDLDGGVANAVVRQVGFTEFNAGGSRAAELPAAVRIAPQALSVAQDLEPEFVVTSADSRTAYISLQENNAIAVLDIAAARVQRIVALGLKDHGQAGRGLDASDRDGIDIALEPGLFGLHMPDGIDVYTLGGIDYVLTANEGDSRDDVDECGIDDFANLAPGLAARTGNNDLGRLDLICDLARDTTGDGLIDQVTAFGARSFSIVGPEGIVGDSGDDFERITAHLDQLEGRVVFNASNSNNSRENRSDNKGPEPEGVVHARISGRDYAFIGLERVGGIMVYEVSNPRLPRFVDYVISRDFSQDPETGMPGDLGPEGLLFIPAADSPNGQNLFVVGNEVSGSTTIYQVVLD